jgi:hypothetical protein
LCVAIRVLVIGVTDVITEVVVIDDADEPEEVGGRVGFSDDIGPRRGGLGYRSVLCPPAGMNGVEYLGAAVLGGYEGGLVLEERGGESPVGCSGSYASSSLRLIRFSQ